MSGYWLVEVTSPVNGDVYFAARPYTKEEARFEDEREAEAFAEEVLEYYEDELGYDNAEIKLAFVSDMSDKYKGETV